MNPSSIAIKRIFNDIKDLNNDPLEKEGIYHYYNDSNVMNAKIMMIGPEDTPYENGFYFFNFTFPNDYPFNPPGVKYETRDGNVRFNPNLYACGKVCLSLINTWEGPKWTSCQTIRSVLISLRGLVLGTKHPLQNEPGYEKCVDSRSLDYNEVIRHENFRVAVVRMMEHPPMGFEVFLPKMLEYLKLKYPWYHTKLSELSKFDNTKISSVYSMNINRNYSESLKGIQRILEKNGTPISVKSIEAPKEYEHNPNGPSAKPDEFYVGFKKISDKDGKPYEVKEVFHNDKKIKTWVESVIEVVQKTDQGQQEQKEQQKKQKEDEKKKKGAPKASAKDFDIGKVVKSENDGRFYEVKEIGAEGKKYKRWVLTTKQEDNDVLTGKKEKVIDNNEKEEQDSQETGNEKGKRKAPNKQASSLDVGTEMKSENDGKMYVVKSVGKEGKEFKRWVLKKK